MKCTKPVKLQGGLMPCGQCMACRITRAALWSLRLTHEQQYHKKSCFATLTYDDAHLPYNLKKTETNSLYPKDLTNFWKKLRKVHNKEFKYFSCGEYGDETQRPHYHAIIFGLNNHDQDAMVEAWGMSDPLQLQIKTLTMERINYVTGYICKKLTGRMADEEYKGREPPFQRNSQGLGLKWAQDNKYLLWTRYKIRKEGKEVPIPRYYRQKLDMPTETDTHPDRIRPNITKWADTDEMTKHYEDLHKELKQIELNIASKFNIQSRRGGHYV